jgi:hypothetical protein
LGRNIVPIKIVFARIVDDSDLAELNGSIISKELIELPHLE